MDVKTVPPDVGVGLRLPERRREQRICDPFPARVKGVDADGRKFEVDTVIDNISAQHLYLRLIPCVRRGVPLRVTFRLSADAAKADSSTRVEIKGRVIRADEKPGQVCGVALAFESHRFHFGADHAGTAREKVVSDGAE